MPKEKTKLEAAAGKLISAIQKEWGKELGAPEAEASQDVMDKGHDLLKCAKSEDIQCILNGMSVTQFLGDIWVHKHPTVKEPIAYFEAVLSESKNV